MTDRSPRLDFPLIAASQAQKHVTHNEAILRLDDLLHAIVRDAHRASPPPAPAEGDRHLVAAGATEEWAGMEGRLAVREAGAWRFVALGEGTLLVVADPLHLLLRLAGTWTEISRRTDRLGIGTEANPETRLAVAAPSSRLTHDGAGHRLVINKATAAETASVILQTGDSGRVEIGTAGDDRLHVKGSADGSAWTTLMVLDPATGRVGIGTLAPAGPLHIMRGAANPIVERTESTPTGSGFETRKARGTPGAPEAVQNGDVIQSAVSSAHDGTTFIFCCNIRSVVDGAPSSGFVPARIEFLTMGSGGMAERMRLTRDGCLGIGTPAPSATLDVAGTVRIGQFVRSALPSAASTGAGALAYVSDEAGGGVIAFSDGTDWRRVTDRAVV